MSVDTILPSIAAHRLGLLAGAGAILAGIVTARSAVTGRFPGRGGTLSLEIGSGRYFFHLAMRIAMVGLIALYAVRLW